MDFALNDEQREIREMVHDICLERVEPRAAEIDVLVASIHAGTREAARPKPNPMAPTGISHGTARRKCSIRHQPKVIMTARTRPMVTPRPPVAVASIAARRNT